MPEVCVRRTRFIAAILSLTLAAATAAQAQRSMGRPQHATLNLAAGVSAWDLDGTGNSVVFAARLDYPLGMPGLLAEGSLSTFRAGGPNGRNTYLVPEVQLQHELSGAIAPYFGAGLGAVMGGDAYHDGDLTVSAAAGLRLWDVIRRGVIRAELRLRAFGRDFDGKALETTVGIGWTF